MTSTSRRTGKISTAPRGEAGDHLGADRAVEADPFATGADEHRAAPGALDDRRGLQRRVARCDVVDVVGGVDLVADEVTDRLGDEDEAPPRQDGHGGAEPGGDLAAPGARGVDDRVGPDHLTRREPDARHVAGRVLLDPDDERAEARARTERAGAGDEGRRGEDGLHLEVLGIPDPARQVRGQVGLEPPEPRRIDRLGVHAGPALAVGERRERGQGRGRRGDDDAALLVELEGVAAQGLAQLDPEPTAQAHEVELVAGALVGQQEVALTAARRARARPVAVDEDDLPAGPGGIPGAGGADDPGTDDDDAVHGPPPSGRSRSAGGRVASNMLHTSAEDLLPTVGVSSPRLPHERPLVTTPPALSGHSVVAGRAVPGRAGSMHATSPATGAALEPAFTLLDQGQVAEAVGRAHEAFGAYRATSPTDRAAFLEAVADEIEAVGEALVARGMLETGLPEARLAGERGRTCGQLRMFAGVVRDGGHRGIRVDPALPERTPLPRPDLRLRQVPLGPVVVFGASNFPLAFSTAGGDTASALAAGCPVVVKAHPAHPGTAEIVAQAVATAAARTGMPDGVFALVHGVGTEVGLQLVTDPRVAAVGFTGSRGGGLALVAAAATRAVPIPVYAEMSSVNPVVVLPGALAGGPEATDALASGYLGSLTGSAGQLCTKPGLAFVPRGDAGDAFVAAVARQQADAVGTTMLTPGISEAYRAGVDRLTGSAAVETVVTGVTGDGPHAPAGVVASTDLSALADDATLTDEVFGAAGLVVRWDPQAADGTGALLETLAGLEGQLTATLRLDPTSGSDLGIARQLVEVLELRAGRLLVNGWPTGVEVTHAMVHGGPYPATSDARTTSVGSLAIERFQRPVCYQDLPVALLPTELEPDNPWGLPRLVDGRPA